jgi:hypothetical protein
MFENERTSASNNPSEFYLTSSSASSLDVPSNHNSPSAVSQSQTTKAPSPRKKFAMNSQQTTSATSSPSTELFTFDLSTPLMQTTESTPTKITATQVWLFSSWPSVRCSHQALQKPHLFVLLHANGYMLPNDGSQPPLKSPA